MATIVQDYGPIYGEVVNGTVQGRPNGSVYVPISNTISMLDTTGASVGYYSAWGTYRIYGAGGLIPKVVAVAQDLSSNIRLSLYSDASLTTQVGTSYDVVAGSFNRELLSLSRDTQDNLVSGNPYYLVATLMNNGTAVATSGAVEVIAV